MLKLRFDRLMEAKAKRKLNCSDRSRQCGNVCVSIKKKCHKGGLSSEQERLKKLKRSGANDLEIAKAKRSIKDNSTDIRKKVEANKTASLRRRVTSSGRSTGSSLAELDPNEIEVDPKRFQYKLIGEHTKTGEVGSLSGVQRYDPNLSGILQVWKDPADGKTYVVNGHNRLALGKRLGADRVAVRYLDAPNAKVARSIGALTNIAEGRGDALDAAKFFRDTGITREDLAKKGIPLREKIATDGLGLSKLDDSLFRKTIDGEIPVGRAAIIGGSNLNGEQQRDLMKLVDKEGKRKNITDDAIKEMIDIAKSSSSRQEETLSLFGAETVQKTNMIEKAQLQSAIKKRLSREKKLFGTVARSGAAQDLARGGNQIDREKSGAISDQAQRAMNVFDKLKNLSGPISQSINEAADRVANGENKTKVERELYEQILNNDVISSRERLAA